MRTGYTILPLVGLLASCGARSAVDHVRFKNQAPVTVVNDRLHVENQPEETPIYRALYHFDGHFHRLLTRKMEFRGTGRARNVNSMDEVPNSTWFTNRLGIRTMSPGQVARGPNQGPGPEAARPWTILSSKVGGAAPGFIIKDARGERYLLKFDQKGFPELDTAADVIVARLLWAIGYNVPEDRVVYFHKDDLVISPDATVKDVFGNKSKMTQKAFERELGRVEVGKDGSIRGLVSKFVSGKPLGGRTRDWPRDDDKNDVINHHERRDIRGQYAFFSWLDHADIKEDNTLDVYIEDPKDPKVRYVKHYLIDFGNALGNQAVINALKLVGHSHRIDFAQIAASFFTLGIWRRPWEDRAYPHIRGIGYLDTQSFHPGKWKPYTPSYFAFHDSDRFDNFWASKILIRFTTAHFRAVVKEARYSDPQAEEYMVQVLRQRQRKVARYWFDRVNPLDGFDIDGERLCFDDLLIKYRLDYATGRTSYRVRGYDYDGEPTGLDTRIAATRGGRGCLSGVKPSSSKDGYTVLRIDTDRSVDKTERPTQQHLPGLLLHLATGPSGTLRIIGLRRL